MLNKLCPIYPQAPHCTTRSQGASFRVDLWISRKPSSFLKDQTLTRLFGGAAQCARIYKIIE